MNNSKNKIPFGVKNGLMVEVSEVDSGLNCKCLCPCCGAALQARKGRKVIHHFAHSPSDSPKDCINALETSIHSMAKQILSEERRLLLPSLTVRVVSKDVSGEEYDLSEEVTREGFKIYDRVEEERWLGDIRPDIIIYIDDVPCLVEVAVTSFCNKEKRDRIRRKKVSAVEIDLSGAGYATCKDDLRELIISTVENRRWISYPEAGVIKDRLKSDMLKNIQSIKEEISGESGKLGLNFKLNELKPTDKRHPEIANNQLRWFRCEACRHLFDASKQEAPKTIARIKCPECDFLVSTRSIAP